MEDTKDQLPSSQHEYTTKNSPTTDQKNDKKLCSHKLQNPPTDRQTDRLAGSPTETLKKLMILPMHQNIRTETREAETLTCYPLQRIWRKKKERKKEHCDPFLSSIPHHPTAADQRWIYGCKGFVKWAAK
jgi:hypothetical protein